MTDEEEHLALAAAREAAGWHSPPTMPVWVVSPDLTGNFDELYFKEFDDAISYIEDHLSEKIEKDYDDAKLTRYGFTLRLWRKLISKEQYQAMFDRGGSVDPDQKSP